MFGWRQDMGADPLLSVLRMRTAIAWLLQSLQGEQEEIGLSIRAEFMVVGR